MYTVCADPGVSVRHGEFKLSLFIALRVEGTRLTIRYTLEFFSKHKRCNSLEMLSILYPSPKVVGK